MSTNDNKFHELKIVVIGTAGTGKTSFVHKWTKGIFEETYRATIVTEFAAKIYTYNERRYRVQVWDIGGQDRNKSVAQIFAKDAHGCLILASCKSSDTLADSGKWKKTIEDSSGQIPCILIENKCDLLSEEEREDMKEINEAKIQYGFIKAFRSSVKENINVTEAMEFLLEHIIESIQKEGDRIQEAKEERKSIRVLDQSHVEPKSCCK